MNLKGDESGAFDAGRISDADRWILHRLNMTVEKVNTLFDAYRLFEAADLLYHFFWDEYCDWYLEFSKCDIEQLGTRKVLKFTLFRILQLLHPLMPFITEEIYQKIKAEKDFLVQTEFPQFDVKMVFPESHADVEWVKKLIAETRKTRTENHIDPQKRVPIYLRPGEAEERQRMVRLIRYFDFLTRSQKTEIVEDLSGMGRGFRGVSQGWEVLLPFDSDENRLQELKRLQGEHEKLLRQIEQLEAKLANDDFVSRAPANVVQNFKKNLQDAIEKRDKLGKTIVDLS